MTVTVNLTVTVTYLSQVDDLFESRPIMYPIKKASNDPSRNKIVKNILLC